MENEPLMATSAKTVSGPVVPGVGRAFELDAAGSGVEADPGGAGPPGDTTDGELAVGDDGGVDAALGCGDVTDEVTGADGPPECEAMQPVVVRPNAPTPQPIARARRRLTRIAPKVSIATDPGTTRPWRVSARHGPGGELCRIADMTLNLSV